MKKVINYIDTGIIAVSFPAVCLCIAELGFYKF